MNKTVGVMEHLDDMGCDICLVQETFLREADSAKLREIKDYGWNIVSDPRKHRGGGGIGILYKPGISLKTNEKVIKYKSFQVMESLLHSTTDVVRLVNIYRPPYTKKAKYTESKFLEEFECYLDDLGNKSGIPIIMGDFNIHMERPDDFYPNKFNRLLSNYDMKQWVPLRPTHELGGTLDLVISNSSLGSKFGPFGITASGTSSDHFLVWVDLELEVPINRQESSETVSYRDFKTLNTKAFKDDICHSALSQSISSLSLDEAVAKYNDVLTGLMDKHCPVISKKMRRNHTPWMDEELRNLRRKRRAAERAWRKGKGLKKHYIELQKYFTTLEFKKRGEYNRKSLKASAGDTKTLYKKVNRLIGKAQQSLPHFKDPVKLAEDFKDFFASKVDGIRQSINDEATIQLSDIDNKSIPSKTDHDSKLENFAKVSVEDLRNIVNAMSNKFCGLDPIPTFLLKQCFDELSSILLHIVNLSLETAKFPSDLKKAVIKPTLKKDDADIDCLKNYRPVSNLPVISKLLEKVVLNQLNDYLEINSLHCPVQSGYRPLHSCETLLVRMTDDILKDMEQGCVVTLVLLDLSAAFDTIDHDILIKKLLEDFGIQGSALRWFEDYLRGRSFCVKVDGGFSEFLCLLFGVPQGSLLGPVLFILYIKQLQMIAAKYGLNIQLYADDSQLYISFHPQRSNEIDGIQTRINNCLVEIKKWMIDNYMKLNESKTELLVIGKQSVLRELQTSVTVKFGEVEVQETVCKGDSWKSLGVKFDQSMKMERQVNSVKQKSMWTISNLIKIGRFLDQGIKLILVKQLVISKLDYCNALYVNLPMKTLKKLKSALNSGIRFIYNINDRNEDLLPYYRKAHILPIEQRIIFKICLLSYKVVNGFAPDYLCELVVMDKHSDETKTRQRSGDNLRLKVPRPSKTRIGDRRFSNCAPGIWNALPLEIRSSQSVDTFKKLLKTHLFKFLGSY